MRSKVSVAGDGFIQELLPSLKNGVLFLRSVLDILIERIEEVEKGRQVDVREETYSSIRSALEAESKKVRTKEVDPAIRTAKIEVLETVIDILARQMETSDKKRRARPKARQRHPHKVRVG